MIKWIMGTLDRVFAVIGAAFFSQAPMFMQQYKQQLAGHIAELKLQIEAMQQAAVLSGKELTAFIQKFLNNSDIDFVRQGEIMQKMTERFQNLSDSYAALEGSNALSRPFIFLSHYSSDIATSTFKTFKMGVEFSLEGVIYAFVGVLIGYSFFASLRRGFQAIVNLFRRRKTNP